MILFQIAQQVAEEKRWKLRNCAYLEEQWPYLSPIHIKRDT